MDVLLSAPGPCVTEFSYQLGHTELHLSVTALHLLATMCSARVESWKAWLTRCERRSLKGLSLNHNRGNFSETENSACHIVDTAQTTYRFLLLMIQAWRFSVEDFFKCQNIILRKGCAVAAESFPEQFILRKTNESLTRDIKQLQIQTNSEQYLR